MSCAHGTLHGEDILWHGNSFPVSQWSVFSFDLEVLNRYFIGKHPNLLVSGCVSKLCLPPNGCAPFGFPRTRNPTRFVDVHTNRSCASSHQTLRRLRCTEPQRRLSSGHRAKVKRDQEEDYQKGFCRPLANTALSGRPKQNSFTLIPLAACPALHRKRKCEKRSRAPELGRKSGSVRGNVHRDWDLSVQRDGIVVAGLRPRWQRKEAGSVDGLAGVSRFVHAVWA